MSEWTSDWRDGCQYVENRGGVSWADASLPWRWHRCRPQTWGYISTGGRPPEHVYRCACGATALDRPDHWMNRNSRRKERRP